ncbi:dsDNA nuclease domain-containing protein [Providencia alcalifaciens]
MALSDALLTVDQAERGGENALRGFTYQASWGIDYLLEKQKEKATYLFLFEYHDDILVLNSSKSPTSAEFIQVKTKKDGKWTLPAIVNATKAKPKSFVAKLYNHFYQFVGHEIYMVLLSNAGFDFLNDNNEKGSDLSCEHKNLIITKVQEQLNTKNEVPLNKIKFKTSELSLLDPNSHLYGKVAVFLNSYFGDEHGINPTSFTNLLIKKCNEKVCIASSEIKTFEDLAQKKGISSEFITDLLSELIASIKMTPEWEHVCLLLDPFESPYERIKLQAVFRRISINVLNVNSVYYFYFLKTQSTLKSIESYRDIPVRDLFSTLETTITEGEGDFSLLNQEEKFMIAIYAVIKLTFKGVSYED